MRNNEGRKKDLDSVEDLFAESESGGIIVAREKEKILVVRLSKNAEKEMLDYFKGMCDALFEFLLFYYTKTAKEFFKKIKPLMIRAKTKAIGLILTGLTTLMSTGISIYLYVSGLPDAGQLFIYPAVLSLIMFAIIAFKGEEEYAARR